MLPTTTTQDEIEDATVRARPEHSDGRPPTAEARVRSATIVIEPTSRWSLGLRELWAYKSLLYFIAWRDVKIRYTQTVFGVAWAVIQPVMLMIVFSVVLGSGLGVSSDGFPYPVFVLAGLVPWTLFARSLDASSQSLVASAPMVEKIYFPRLILPVAAAGSILLEFGISFLVLLAMMVWYGIVPTWAVVFLPLMTVLATLAALAFGIWLSALYVRYRDLRHAIPFMIQFWLFATPVAYSQSAIPDSVKPLFALNPMTGAVEGFRWALLGADTAPGLALAASVVVTLLVLISGLYYFQRTSRTFADVI